MQLVEDFIRILNVQNSQKEQDEEVWGSFYKVTDVSCVSYEHERRRILYVGFGVGLWTFLYLIQSNFERKKINANFINKKLSKNIIKIYKVVFFL
jgi:hypothetical protein